MSLISVVLAAALAGSSPTVPTVTPAQQKEVVQLRIIAGGCFDQVTVEMNAHSEAWPTDLQPRVDMFRQHVDRCIDSKWHNHKHLVRAYYDFNPSTMIWTRYIYITK